MRLVRLSIEAIWIMASELAGRVSQSRARRRCSMIQPILRSTTQRLLTTWKPRTPVSADEFDVDSEAGAVLHDGVLEAGVDPALGDRRVGLLGLVEEQDSDGVPGKARGGDGHGEDESDRVGEDAPFPADDLLGGVGSLAGQGRIGGGLHALGVDHGSGRFRLASFLRTGQAGQIVVELGEDSLVAPGGVIGVDSAMVGEVVRKVFPGDSGAVDVEECQSQLASSASAAIGCL
jgi:hypothetical protein